MAILCKYLSFLDRWLIHERMRFLVKSIGRVASVTLDRVSWKTRNPQYFRSEEEVDANRDSSTTIRKNSGNDDWGAEESKGNSRSIMVCQTKWSSGFQLPAAAIDWSSESFVLS